MTAKQLSGQLIYKENTRKMKLSNRCRYVKYFTHFGPEGSRHYGMSSYDTITGYSTYPVDFFWTADELKHW